MKKTLFFILSIALVLSFSHCNNENIPDVQFQVTVQAPMQVTVASTNQMTESVVIDVSTDPEIKKYLEKIKGYEVTEVLFAIDDYSTSITDEIYFTGDIGFSRIIDVQPFKKCSVDNLPITHWAGTGFFDIDACNDLFSEMGEMLLADNGIKVYMTGAFTKAPLTFNLKIKMTMTVTAAPL